MAATTGRETITTTHAAQALGWLSAEFAARADAWNGNELWRFPEPPEWLDLWERALNATAESARPFENSYRAALAAGNRGMQELADALGTLSADERSHLLTIGSPARGLCLRVTLGSLSRHGKWRGWMPNAFWIWRGKRVT